MAAEVDLLVLAELNPDVLVSSGDADMRFGQVEQLIDRASITLGSSGAITACAAAAQGLRVAVCAVIGDDPIGEWTAEQLRGHGVDIAGVIRRPGRQTGMSVVLTRSDGDRAILTYAGTMPELTSADIAPDRLRSARHVHVSSFFLQGGLQAGLAGLFGAARQAGATTSLDTGWAPADEWASAGPALRHVHYLLPNAAECATMETARASRPRSAPRRFGVSGQTLRSSWARAAPSPSPAAASRACGAAPSLRWTPREPATASTPGSSWACSTARPRPTRSGARSPAARSPSPAGAAPAGWRPAPRRSRPRRNCPASNGQVGSTSPRAW